MMQTKRAYLRGKTKQREAKALKVTWDNVKRFGGISDPGPETLQKYIFALDDLADEMAEQFEDLGSGPNSARGRIDQERNHALALLARLKIDQVKPSDF